MKSISLFFILISLVSFSQTNNDNVYTAPEYRGGKEELKYYLISNYRYPYGETKEGTIKVKFNLNEYGYIYNATIIEGLSEKLDQEALRVINDMNSWRAARKNGHRVETTVTLPIKVVYTNNTVEQKVEDEEVVEEYIPMSYLSDTPPPPPNLSSKGKLETDVESVVIEEEVAEDTARIYEVAEVNPEFFGGEVAMKKFFSENFVYPDQAKEMGEQGTVFMQFVVTSIGNIEDVKVIKGVSSSIDLEAIRVVSIMPRWKPGKQGGKRVNVRFVLPLRVRLY